jgi:hypothetical protein
MKFLGFEWYRIVASKKLLFLFLGCFGSLCLIATGIYWSQEPLRSELPEGVTTAMQLDMYQMVIENNLSELEGDISIHDRAYLVDQNAKFQYYIDTQTTEFEYLDYHYPTNRIVGAEWVGFMFFLGGISAYALYAFAVFVPAFVYGLDYESGFLKNIIAAPRSRRMIFWMKGGFSSLTIMVFGLFLFVLALILGQFDSNGQVFLLIQNGVVHTIAANKVFLAFALGQLILSAVLTSLTTLVVVLTKNITFSAGASATFYLICQLVGGRMEQQMALDQNVGWNYQSFLGVPFFDVKYLYPYGFSSMFLAVVGAYIMISFSLNFAALRRFRKQDL